MHTCLLEVLSLVKHLYILGNLPKYMPLEDAQGRKWYTKLNN